MTVVRTRHRRVFAPATARNVWTPARRDVIDFQMTGRERRDLFISYIAALERHELKLPRLEPFYREHKYCRVDDLFGTGHPPDTVVAMALAYHAFRTGRQPGDYGITM